MKLLNRAFPLILFSLVLMIIIPVPTFMLDILLMINLAISSIIFLLSMYTRTILEFSILPTALLYTTLTRIILNVTSARIILSRAEGGKVIEAIGKFSINGDYIVGSIIFIIITIVMFIVITKGSERVAEVSARFSLDALPGKQMSIDADLNSGAITLAIAKKRREELQKESDFFKSMDGANKFVRGDAIAGVIITIINIVGGLIMGVLRHNMDIATAASTYTILSIGDGLVNQVPSLLIAVSTAAIITKGNSDENVSSDLLTQLLQYKQPLQISSAIFAIIGLFGLVGIISGLPWFISFVVSGILYAFSKMDVEQTTKEENEDSFTTISEPEYQQDYQDNYLYVDKILLQVGSNIVNAITTYNSSNGSAVIAHDLKMKIEKLKEKIKKTYGIKLPEIRILDDDYISSNSFVVKIPNAPAIPLETRPNCTFAAFMGNNTEIDFGEEASLPELGLKGYWVATSDEQEAESMGAITYDLFYIIIQHLENCIENNLDKLISREEIKQYKTEVSSYNSAIVDEINTKQIENSLIQKVIQNMLMEKISIKNFEYILECISDCVSELGNRANPDIITQYVRIKMSNVLTENKIENGTLRVVTLSQESHELLGRKIKGEINEETETKSSNIFVQIATTHKQLTDLGDKFVFLCDRSIRTDIFKTLSDFKIKIDIISFDEVPRFVRLDKIKEI